MSLNNKQVISCPKDANSFASDFAPLKKGKRYEILLVDVLKKKDAWARNVYRSFMCVCVFIAIIECLFYRSTVCRTTSSASQRETIEALLTSCFAKLAASPRTGL